MVLTPRHATHLDVYTLFCRYMAEHLECLRLACDESELSFSSCTERFDAALRTLLTSRIGDRSKAIAMVARNVQTAIDDSLEINPDAARWIARAREEALDNQTVWQYSDAIEVCHEQGRNLALMFFENAIQPEIKKRLSRRATLNYQFGSAQIAQKLRAVRELAPSPRRQRLEDIIATNWTREETKNYREPSLPGALYTFQGKRSDDFTIHVPLHSDNNLGLYVSYPYLFMHEYTAHIFSSDYFNNRFNDGWMLYAASRYLLNNWARDPMVSTLTSAQVFAFNRYLLKTLSDASLEHHNFAEEFDQFLLPWDQKRFDSITYELAAYEPARGEAIEWPTWVLKKLSQGMLDRAALQNSLARSPTLDALYPGLKVELPAGRRV